MYKKCLFYWIFVYVVRFLLFLSHWSSGLWEYGPRPLEPKEIYWLLVPPGKDSTLRDDRNGFQSSLYLRCKRNICFGLQSSLYLRCIRNVCFIGFSFMLFLVRLYHTGLPGSGNMSPAHWSLKKYNGCVCLQAKILRY